jgi:hypothetical protein
MSKCMSTLKDARGMLEVYISGKTNNYTNRQAKSVIRDINSITKQPDDLIEGYHEVTVVRDEDCDHGPCTGYVFSNGDTFYTYDDHPTLVSLHKEN